MGKGRGFVLCFPHSTLARRDSRIRSNSVGENLEFGIFRNENIEFGMIPSENIKFGITPSARI